MAVKPALLIVAHGERGGMGDDRLVHAVADRLEGRGDYRTVKGCFISKEPTLKTTVEDLSPGPVTICPLFMSNGYFVKQAIPASIEETREVRVLAPIGLSPRLPQLVAGLARDAAGGSGRVARDCRLLLVAHGSKHDTASRDATRSVAACIEQSNDFAGVEMCFLEESPFLDDQLGQIEGPVIAAGLFIGEGMHGGEDLPAAIAKSGRDDIVMSRPLGQAAGLMDLIVDDLDETPRLPSHLSATLTSFLNQSSQMPLKNQE